MGDRGGAGGASRPSLQHPSLVRSKAGGTYAAYLADGGGGVPLWRSSAERPPATTESASFGRWQHSVQTNQLFLSLPCTPRGDALVRALGTVGGTP